MQPGLKYIEVKAKLFIVGKRKQFLKNLWIFQNTLYVQTLLFAFKNCIQKKKINQTSKTKTRTKTLTQGWQICGSMSSLSSHDDLH